MRVVWSAEARDQVVEIRAFIMRNGSPGAGARVARSLRELGDSLREHPWRGRGVGRADAPVRELRHPTWPYSVQYVIDESRATVVIITVWHDAQDEGRVR